MIGDGVVEDLSGKVCCPVREWHEAWSAVNSIGV